jgi:hypothetical protein
MSANRIDFPPWQKSGGTLQDGAFLPEDGVFAVQPFQLLGSVFCSPLVGKINLTVASLADPPCQRRKPDAHCSAPNAPPRPQIPA